MDEIKQDKTPSPEQFQREELGKRQMSMEEFSRRIKTLLGGMPVKFAKKKPGTDLVDALYVADDYLTQSRNAIEGEIFPIGE
jgi:hypothetical protein